jgi:hypothetical protein
MQDKVSPIARIALNNPRAVDRGADYFSALEESEPT